MSNVSHPTHYNSGKIEVIEAIEDWKINFHRGNAVKYIARAGKKDPLKEIEDLEKAAWYLAREIETLKAKKEGREAIRPNDMNPRTNAHAPDPFMEAVMKNILTGPKTYGEASAEDKLLAKDIARAEVLAYHEDKLAKEQRRARMRDNEDWS